jgi:hypothetical protein
MRTTSLIATSAALAALLVGPGLAAGDPPAGSPSGDHSQAGSHPAVTQTPAVTPAAETPPGPNASAETKAKAYGKQCQDQSKKHVAGQKGTPFSQCVTALAKVATGKANPTTACKTLSKKHVAGQKGTPYSRCVVAAAKLQKEQGDESAGSQS